MRFFKAIARFFLLAGMKFIDFLEERRDKRLWVQRFQKELHNLKPTLSRFDTWVLLHYLKCVSEQKYWKFASPEFAALIVYNQVFGEDNVPKKDNESPQCLDRETKKNKLSQEDVQK